MSKQRSGLYRFWRKLGPGLITGASDDDPSGIATYSQAGAQFGLATLWTALISFPLMYALQEMCARIGIVTRKGLAAVVKEHYPRWVIWTLVMVSAPAMVLNIGANIAGMGAAAHMLFPGIHAAWFSIGMVVMLIIVMIKLNYRRFARFMKYLCMSLLVYFIVPFMVKQDFSAIVKNSVWPEISFTKEYMLILVGILGTTLSPYLFFWQTSMEVEANQSVKPPIVLEKYILPRMRLDVRSGMLFSNLVMYFIILTSGSVLFTNGIHEINTVEDAAAALRPLAGEASYLLFAIGIIGTGLIAIPVLAGGLSYMVAEMSKWNEGFDKKFFEAREFYLVIIIATLSGLAIQLIGISPVKALLYTAVAYGITAPIIIALLLHLCNNKKIMQDFTNNKTANILGGLALLLMTASAIALFWLTI
ncbi:MAG: NRAMP family divalent metal transporter [Chitinophagaceae bacterium]